MPSPSDITIERCDPADQRAALAKLLTGSDCRDDPTVDHFLQISRQQSLDLRELWISRDRDRVRSAALLVPSTGRAAMLFLSPTDSEATRDEAAAVVSRLCESLDGDDIHLVQALLEPTQVEQARVLEHAAFTPLAKLVYMEKRVRGRTVAPLELPEGVEAIPWSESAREDFGRAILASYEQTLDCPGLLGVRTIDDILAGHIAAGKFRPDLWFALYREDEPVGVLLLNESGTRPALELVYLGLSVNWRGQGLARRMMEHAIGEVARLGLTSMLLAVDDRNTPALRLYESLGFVPHSKKSALIRALSVG